MSNIATNEEAQTFQVTSPAAPASRLTHFSNGAAVNGGGSTNLTWEQFARVSPAALADGSVILAGQSIPLSPTQYLVRIPLNFSQLTATDPILTYTPPVHQDTPGLATFTIDSFCVVEQTAIVGAGGSITLSLKMGATPVTGASVVVAVATRAPRAWIGAAGITAANTGTAGVTGIKVVGAAVTAITAGRVAAQMVLTYS